MNALVADGVTGEMGGFIGRGEKAEATLVEEERADGGGSAPVAILDGIGGRS